jgi:putative transposase
MASDGGLGISATPRSISLRLCARYLIFDREHTFQSEVLETATNLGVKPIRLAIRSPWQNRVAERFVESCRRDLFNHVIVLNKRHMKRLLTEYVCYYHDDRTHLGLEKETPAGRVKEANHYGSCPVLAFPRLGGLHHRYQLAA